jgi:acyl-CoA synthetase (AMP-forming)/AMP-acid ligase II
MRAAAVTLRAVVEARARDHPRASVIGAPGRSPLDAAGLSALVSGLGAALRERGIGPAGRVVLVTHNGPEAAAAFLAVAGAAACAPLNPLYRERELEFALDDLQADAVIVDRRLDSPVRAVAVARGIPVLELDQEPDGPAGSFRLNGWSLPSAGAADDEQSPATTALLLHTSGTTSRPKLVPLSQANLVASARNVAATLELAAADSCLNVMPLFHIHGLVAAVLAPLVSGSSVSCTSGFDGLQFPAQLAESGATWTTAVPTAHHSLLHAVRDRPDAFAGLGLRFLRSSSAALPAPLLEGLEDALGVPVVEAYGMTEAAHQMASNPLPPGRRVAGSVGLAAGPEIAILDDEGRELPRGSVGEISIRGENVFGGYEANPEANAAAFSGDWFRTGDEGWLDDKGYLFLRGRLKEIINRGGEKIAPREVDEVLAAHPSVAQVVTFAVPDERLGEDVAAAIVLAPGAVFSERELQVYAVDRLAPFKVPRRVLMVDEIPKGATGKLQRIGLAETLGLTGDAAADGERAAAPTMLELELCKLWAQALGRAEVDPRDDFFALGGDSLRGAELVARIRDLCGRPGLPLIALVRAPTVERMLVELREGAEDEHGLLVPFGPQDGTALFLVHGVLGDVVGFAALAARLGPHRPIVGIRAHGVDGGGAGPETVEEMADAYLTECRGVQPKGPYRIGGFCMGAPIAVEMARSLARDGERVGLLLLDPRVSPPRDLPALVWTARQRLRKGDLRSVLTRRQRTAAAAAEAASMPTWDRLARARNAYRPRPIDIPAALVTSSDHVKWGVPPWWWGRYLRGDLRRYSVVGEHDFLLHVPAVDRLATAVATALDEMA